MVNSYVKFRQKPILSLKRQIVKDRDIALLLHLQYNLWMEGTTGWNHNLQIRDTVYARARKLLHQRVNYSFFFSIFKQTKDEDFGFLYGTPMDGIYCFSNSH